MRAIIPFLAHSRNQHNVPLDTIIRQDIKLRHSIAVWPPYWPAQKFINGN